MPIPWIRYCRRGRSHVGFNHDLPNCICDLCLFARILAIDQQRHPCYYLGKAFCVTLANLGSPTLLKYSPTSQKQDMLRDIGKPCVVFAEYREDFSLGFPFRFVFSFLLHSLGRNISYSCWNDFTRKPGSPVLFCVQCFHGNEKVVKCVRYRPETVRRKILSSKRRGRGGILVRVDLGVVRATLLSLSK